MHEEEWIEEGSEGEPELPLLYDVNGRVTMSALENVGMESTVPFRIHGCQNMGFTFKTWPRKWNKN